MSNFDIKSAIELHSKWVTGQDGGVKLTLPIWSNLSWSNLNGSNLSWSNLNGSNLSGSNLSWSNLSGSNLSWSNLSWSNLSGSNLSWSNLFNTTGNNCEIKTVQAGQYIVNYTYDRLQIGCKNHVIEDWWVFTDKQILVMDGQKALDWWRVWKPILQQIIAVNPAKATGHENV